MLVLIALAVNPATIGALFAGDGDVTSPVLLVAIYGFEIVALVAGIVLLRRDERLRFGPVALFTASGALAIAAAESLLRLKPEYRPVRRWYAGERDSRPSGNFVVDSLTGWRMRPDHTFTWVIDGRPHEYASDARGMRAPAAVTGDCGRPRVILAGDSFVFGSGVAVEETIAAQLADSLGGRAEVYSLGMPGFGLDQIWLSIRHQALGLCPSLVVAVFIDDDWDRSLTAFRSTEGMAKPTFVLDGDTLRPETPADRPGPLRRRLERHSAIWRVAAIAARTRAHTTGTGEWWRLNHAILAAMARDARAAGVPILFVRLTHRGGWHAFPALREAMARAGHAYLDLGDPAHRSDDIHLAADAHLSPRGCAWVAGAISGWIRRSGPASLAAAGTAPRLTPRTRGSRSARRAPARRGTARRPVRTCRARR